MTKKFMNVINKYFSIIIISIEFLWKFLSRFIKNKIILTTIAFFIFLKLLSSFMSLDFINRILELQIDLSDIEYTDLSYKLLDYKKKIDTNIILVDIGYLNRRGIAKLVYQINKFKPKVIGINAFFRNPKDSNDVILKTVFDNTKNLVLVSGLDETISVTNDTTYKFSYSHEMFMENATSGIGRQVFSRDKCVRSLYPEYKINNKREPSFAIEILRLWDTKKLKKYLNKGSGEIMISFSGNLKDFHFFPGLELLNNPDSLFVFRNKIVLLGFLGNITNRDYVDPDIMEDVFYTPLSESLKDRIVGRALPDMYGTVVHANIINMVLNNNYIYNITGLSAIIIEIVFSYLLFFIFYQIFFKKNHYYDLLSKLISFSLIIIFAYLIIYLFAKHHVRIDITGILLVLVFAPDFYEIYNNNISVWIRKFVNLILPNKYKLNKG
ncbi:MAG: CHASE2 domain-containing protein [bacterium]